MPLHDTVQDAGNLAVLMFRAKDAPHLHQVLLREHSLGPVQILLAALDHEDIPCTTILIVLAVWENVHFEAIPGTNPSASKV